MIARHWLKGFSLVFAILVWAYVVSTLPRDVVRTLPLEFILPEKISLISTSAKEVQITLRGPRAFLHQLKNQTLHLPVDLRQFNGPYNFPVEVPLNTHALPVPVGVEVKIVHPQVLRLQLGSAITKTLPLRLTLTGEFASGLQLEKIKVTPEQVTITGPEDEISKMQFIALEAVERTGLTDQGSLTRQAVIDHGRFQLRPAGPYKVEYQLRATKANLTLKKVKIRFVSNRKISSTSTDLVALEVMMENGERKIKKDEIKVFADIVQEHAGKFTVDLRAEMPSDIHLVKIHPERVKVTLK